MPLRRPPDPPPAMPPEGPAAPLQYDPLGEPGDPARPAQAARSGAAMPAPAASAGPAATVAAAPETEAPPPSAAQLRSAARELAQAAERTDRSAREILGRAHALCESLARSLDCSERRTARETLGILVSGVLLSAVTTVLAAIVILHEIQPRWSVLELLRILVHAG
jgi:hypothetical protein